MLSAPGRIRDDSRPLPQIDGVTEKTENSQAEETRRRPFLEPPIPLHYIQDDVWHEDQFCQLQAILQISAQHSFDSYQKELDVVNGRLEQEQVKQREDQKIAREKEYEAGKWGVARLVFTWIASCAVLITGITLIATGVGIVAGCLMLAGGLIQVGSQIMELTGGWEKVRDLLPGKDLDKKNAITSWIQIGITILSLILSGVGVIMAGFSFVGENMQKSTALMGAIALIGKGVSDIGQGITKSDHKFKTADIKRREALMTKYRHQWQDLIENSEESIKTMESAFKITTHQLDLQRDFANVVWGRA